MGQAIPLGNDYTADQLRRLARQTKDVAQARRLLAIAAVLDGASRAEAARIGGMGSVAKVVEIQSGVISGL